MVLGVMKRAVGFQTGPTWVDNWQSKLLWLFTIILVATALILLLKITAYTSTDTSFTGYSILGTGNLVASVPRTLAEAGFAGGSAVRTLTDSNGVNDAGAGARDAADLNESGSSESETAVDLVEIENLNLTLSKADDVSSEASVSSAGGVIESSSISILDSTGRVLAFASGSVDLTSFSGDVEVSPGQVKVTGVIAGLSSNDGAIRDITFGGDVVNTTLNDGRLSLSGTLKRLSLAGEGTLVFANDGTTLDLKSGIVITGFTGAVSYNVETGVVELGGSADDFDLKFR